MTPAQCAGSVLELARIGQLRCFFWVTSLCWLVGMAWDGTGWDGIGYRLCKRSFSEITNQTHQSGDRSHVDITSLVIWSKCGQDKADCDFFAMVRVRVGVDQIEHVTMKHIEACLFLRDFSQK